MRLDLRIDNANLLTMEPAGEADPYGTRARLGSIGVIGDRIVAVGDEAHDVAADRVLDADGRFLAPGFNDVHCHTAWYGMTLLDVSVEKLGTMDAVYAALEAAAKDKAPGEWVTATGFSQNDYDGQYPDIQVLDRIADGRPMFIRQVSGHAAIANSEALERAGVFRDDFETPEGGKVVRNEHGQPTGLIEETAQALVQDLIRPYSRSLMVDAIDAATSSYAQQGLTSFGDAGIAAGWIGHSPTELGAYQEARQNGRLHARGQLMPMADALRPLHAHDDDQNGLGLDLGVVSGFGDPMLRLGPIKIFMDGAMSSETAAMYENYEGSDTPGYFQDDPEVLRARILDTYRAGWSLAVHAIGDKAVAKAIEFICEAQDTYGFPAERQPGHTIPNRIEHAAMVSDPQLKTLREYGIAVTPQAAFADAIGDAQNASLGEARRPLLYRAKAFFDAGVLLPGSSDRPCADGTPLRGIQAFVDRRTRSGDVMGSAEECITPQQALAAYTSIAAEASGDLADKGTLSRGKLADFVFLDENPVAVDPTTIKDINVAATMLGGRFTHGNLD